MKNFTLAIFLIGINAANAGWACNPSKTMKLLNQASSMISNMSTSKSNTDLIIGINQLQDKFCEVSESCRSLDLDDMLNLSCQQRLVTEGLKKSELVQAARQFRPQIKTIKNLLNVPKTGGFCISNFYGSSDVIFLEGVNQVVNSIEECERKFEKNVRASSKSTGLSLDGVTAQLTLLQMDGKVEVESVWSTAQGKWNYSVQENNVD